jgi:hypothetical protein
MSLAICNVNIGLNSSQEILPAQNGCLKNLLSKYFSNILGKENFSLTHDAKGATLSLGNRKVAVLDKADLKQIEEFFNYYKRTGHLPRQELSGKESSFTQANALKVLKDLYQASRPGANDRILAGIRIADDTLGIIRNTMYALPFVGVDDPIANHLGYYAGIVWTFFSFKEIEHGIEEYRRSEMIGDQEGLRVAKARLLSGGIVSTASLTYLAGKICDTFVSVQLAAAFSGIADSFFGLGSLVAMGSSGLGAYRCYRFNQKISAYIENPNLSEKEKMQGALRFLKDQISVTFEEKQELKKRIEEKGFSLSSKEKEELLKQKETELIEVKFKKIKRRVGSKSLHLLQTELDSTLAKLADSKTVKEGIARATLLIHTIQTETRAQMALYILGFLAALISFAALLTGTFFTAGALPFVLYGIAGTIYLALTIQGISDMFSDKGDPNKAIEFGAMPYALPGPHH